MSDQEINIAIAEACGWSDIADCSELTGRIAGVPTLHKLFRQPIPNYCNDLNAMHEAEESLDQEQVQNYTDALRIMPQDKNWAGCTMWHFSPRQRAEAFLRTIGRWSCVGTGIAIGRLLK